MHSTWQSDSEKSKAFSMWPNPPSQQKNRLSDGCPLLEDKERAKNLRNLDKYRERLKAQASRASNGIPLANRYAVRVSARQGAASGLFIIEARDIRELWPILFLDLVRTGLLPLYITDDHRKIVESFFFCTIEPLDMNCKF